MFEEFLNKLGWLKRYLRKYEAGEIDDRWREYLESSPAIKLCSRGVSWSMSPSMTEENSLKLSLAIGFISESGNVKYRVIDEVQILSVSQKDQTVFVSVINTLLYEPAILIVQFHDVNNWDGRFLIETSKNLSEEWCNLVTQVVTPVADTSEACFSLEEMYEILNLLADALYRDSKVSTNNLAAAMRKASGEGMSRSRKERKREKANSLQRDLAKA